MGYITFILFLTLIFFQKTNVCNDVHFTAMNMIPIKHPTVLSFINWRLNYQTITFLFPCYNNLLNSLSPGFDIFFTWKMILILLIVFLLTCLVAVVKHTIYASSPRYKTFRHCPLSVSSQYQTHSKND